MMIKNCTAADIDEIFRLYRLATEHMRKINAPVVWPQFDRQMVATEIAEHRQWKLVIDGQVACVWAITFSDEQIWGERNADAAVYIHRIATNPDYRGKNFVQLITDWAIGYAKNQGLDFVRLDTMGHNTKLIEVYTRAGFNFLGMYDLKSTEGLPEHYHNGQAALFEIKLGPPQV